MANKSFIAVVLLIAGFAIFTKFQIGSKSEVKAYKLPVFSVSSKKKVDHKASVQIKIGNRRSLASSTSPAHSESVSQSADLNAPSIQKTANSNGLLLAKTERESEHVRRIWEKLRDKAYSRLNLPQSALSELRARREQYRASLDQLAKEDVAANFDKIETLNLEYDSFVRGLLGSNHHEHLHSVRQEFNKRVAVRYSFVMGIGYYW